MHKQQDTVVIAILQLLRSFGGSTWTVQCALELCKLKCPTCESVKSGGQMVPRAATYEIPAAWQCVGAGGIGGLMWKTHAAERFVMRFDMAMKWVMAVLLFIYPRAELRQETWRQRIESFSMSTLRDRSRPQWLFADSASPTNPLSLEFLEDHGAGLVLTPE